VRDVTSEAGAHKPWHTVVDADMVVVLLKQMRDEQAAEPSMGEMVDAIRKETGEFHLEWCEYRRADGTQVADYMCAYRDSQYQATTNVNPLAAVRAAWLAVCGGEVQP
jgi:hypothetical protein